MSKQIAVSVICLAYNHSKYIDKTLKGFLMQKTNFNFEVIIHDDASIDNTQDILIRYAKENSNIKLILQKDNKYSQGIDIVKNYIMPLINGQYVAYCEGDDYWIDENKLQILYDYMTSNTGCSVCCHGYENIDANTENLINTVHSVSGDGEICMNQLIQYENPPQLASQMFTRECIESMPELFYNRGVGDYTLLLYSATLGKVYYIDKIMARKRIASEYSWTVRIYKNPEKRIQHDYNMIRFLEDFNEFTNFNYNSAIATRIDNFMFDIYMVKNNFMKQLTSQTFKKQSIKRKMLIIFGCLCSKIAAKINNYILRK